MFYNRSDDEYLCALSELPRAALCLPGQRAKEVESTFRSARIPVVVIRVPSASEFTAASRRLTIISDRIAIHSGSPHISLPSQADHGLFANGVFH